MTADLEFGNPVVVRASAVLTGSYVAGAGQIAFRHHNGLALQIAYTKGDETSLQIKVEVSGDGGTTWAQSVSESASGGTVTTTLAERSFSASGTYAILITPLRGTLAKVSAKATGGTPTGTLSISGTPVWV